MITAHGASEKAMDQVRARGLELMEATCPLVHVAHRAVRTLVREGFIRSSSASGTMLKCAA